jgi:putative FmdB family regulatory protein
MPIYEVRCKQCDHQWEDVLSVTEPFPIVCLKCGETSGERQVSKVAQKIDFPYYFRVGGKDINKR